MKHQIILLIVLSVLFTGLISAQEECEYKGILNINSGGLIKINCTNIHMQKNFDLNISHICNRISFNGVIELKSQRSYLHCTRYDQIFYNKTTPMVIDFLCDDEYTVPILCEIKNIPHQKINLQVKAMEKGDLVREFPELICGDNYCESKYDEELTCREDCPNCEDNDKCTKDYFDYELQKCKNELINDCCGNDRCEEGEYLSCTKDCSNCDDKDRCTEDIYNYTTQTCKHNPILNCCGNSICEDKENYRNCEDCKNRKQLLKWVVLLIVLGILYWLRKYVWVIIITVGMAVNNKIKHRVPFKKSFKEIITTLKKKFHEKSLIRKR